MRAWSKGQMPWRVERKIRDVIPPIVLVSPELLVAAVNQLLRSVGR